MQIDQYRRNDRKNIDENEQNFYLRPCDEMISERLENLLFLIPEIYCHPEKLDIKNTD